MEDNDFLWEKEKKNVRLGFGRFEVSYFIEYTGV